jgi:hypothetical protein
LTPAQSQPLANLPGASTCDPYWNMVSSPNIGTGDNVLFAVAAVSGSDVWAVGYYHGGTANLTVAEHWNGSVWSVVPTPNVGTRENYLDGVAAISGGDVWAVGEYLTSGNYQTLIEHWNGSSWSLSPSPNVNTDDNLLNSVVAISGSDIWAVGHFVTSGIHGTLTEHWNGSVWSIVSSPNMGPSDNKLYSIAAVGSSDVWAVGAYFTPIYDVGHTLTEHWNGTAWSIVPSPNVDPNDNGLNGVAAVGSTNVWAVGQHGNGSGTLVEHWNGSAWSVVPSPDLGVNGTGLGGVDAVTGGDIWAVGDWRDSSYIYHTFIEHWNGSVWSVVPSPDVGPSDNTFSAVAAVSSSDVWAVGNFYQNGTVFQTLVEHYAGMCVTPTPGLTPTACPVQFTDVPVGSTYYPYVSCLACRGIVSGYADGTFKPNDPVTRGQLSKIVSSAAGFSDPQPTQMFQDVPVGSTFQLYIGRLASRGYVSGYPCGGVGEPCVPPGNLPYFRPNNHATRGQISKIDANAAGFSTMPRGQQFEDVAVGSTYYTYTYRLVSLGVMVGYPCGGAGEPCLPPGNLSYFRPNSDATRGQTSKIVAKTFFPDCRTPNNSKR